MPVQVATTGDLENAQRIMLSMARYTEEHNAPCANLIEGFRLAQGEKQVTVPKVGQMTANDLTDGVDMIDSEDIGMTTTDLTSAEVGLKVILTDKLIRQANDKVMQMVGRQMGDGMARKEDRDVIALFSALNGGTTLGADNASFTARNAGACIAHAKANKFGSPMFVVHHPNAIYALTSSMSTVGATASAAIPSGPSADLLKDFYRVTLNQVPFYEDGNIDKISGVDSGYGVIANRGAMAILRSMEASTRPQRDESLRAWEVNVVADYGVFELDDTRGAPLRYEIGDLATNN